MSPKWLTSLVRARQVQEDYAKQQLATAERLATRAHARVRYDNDRVASLVEAGAELTAPSFVAAAVALQAAAATHAAALRAADDAVARVADRRGDLTDAARARYVAEELHEKHTTAERQRAGAFAQREMDEVAARVFRDGTDGAR